MKNEHKIYVKNAPYIEHILSIYCHSRNVGNIVEDLSSICSIPLTIPKIKYEERELRSSTTASIEVGENRTPVEMQPTSFETFKGFVVFLVKIAIIGFLFLVDLVVYYAGVLNIINFVFSGNLNNLIGAIFAFIFATVFLWAIVKHIKDFLFGTGEPAGTLSKI